VVTRTTRRSRRHTVPATGRWWALLAAAWSVIFAAPHLYWATGGRAGLGTQTAAANAALGRTWFVLYNLAVAALALGGTLVALLITVSRVGARARRRFGAAAGAAGVVLLVRGAVGLALLAVGVLRGEGSATPLLLLAIEPWFVIGGIAYAGLGRRLLRAADHPVDAQLA